MNPIKKILVPVDFTEHSGNILRSALMLAHTFDAAVEVVFVVEKLDAYAGFAVPHLPIDKLENDLLARAERKLAEFLDSHMDKSIRHNSKVLNGKVAEEIVRHAEAEGCDLIMIGTHVCRGAHSSLFGSVTERVIKNAPCPVLSMNPCPES